MNVIAWALIHPHIFRSPFAIISIESRSAEEMLTDHCLRVAAAEFPAFASNTFGAQSVDFDCMARFVHIAARLEFNFFLFLIATRPLFQGNCLLAHLRKGN